MTSIAYAFLTYFTAWWITLFCVLPFGLQLRQGGVAARAAMKRVIVWNSLLAGVVTLVIHLILLSGWIPLRKG